MPIQEPITGKEAQTNLLKPQQALAQFYSAFNSGNKCIITAPLKILICWQNTRLLFRVNNELLHWVK